MQIERTEHPAVWHVLTLRPLISGRTHDGIKFRFAARSDGRVTYCVEVIGQWAAAGSEIDLSRAQAEAQRIIAEERTK